MIHLTLHDGSPVIVNPFHIFTIESLGESGCTIVASGGATIEVTESMLQVEKAIRRWTSGGK
jgi:uncharacterized protein YlzI (FlbEa/FlbD family)